MPAPAPPHPITHHSNDELSQAILDALLDPNFIPDEELDVERSPFVQHQLLQYPPAFPGETPRQYHQRVAMFQREHTDIMYIGPLPFGPGADENENYWNGENENENSGLGELSMGRVRIVQDESGGVSVETLQYHPMPRGFDEDMQERFELEVGSIGSAHDDASETEHDSAEFEDEDGDCSSDTVSESSVGSVFAPDVSIATTYSGNQQNALGIDEEEGDANFTTEDAQATVYSDNSDSLTYGLSDWSTTNESDWIDDSYQFEIADIHKKILREHERKEKAAEKLRKNSIAGDTTTGESSGTASISTVTESDQAGGFSEVRDDESISCTTEEAETTVYSDNSESFTYGASDWSNTNESDWMDNSEQFEIAAIHKKILREHERKQKLREASIAKDTTTGEASGSASTSRITEFDQTDGFPEIQDEEGVTCTTTEEEAETTVCSHNSESFNYGKSDWSNTNESDWMDDSEQSAIGRIHRELISLKERREHKEKAAEKFRDQEASISSETTAGESFETVSASEDISEIQDEESIYTATEDAETTVYTDDSESFNYGKSDWSNTNESDWLDASEQFEIARIHRELIRRKELEETATKMFLKQEPSLAEDDMFDLWIPEETIDDMDAQERIRNWREVVSHADGGETSADTDRSTYGLDGSDVGEDTMSAAESVSAEYTLTDDEESSSVSTEYPSTENVDSSVPRVIPMYRTRRVTNAEDPLASSLLAACNTAPSHILRAKQIRRLKVRIALTIRSRYKQLSKMMKEISKKLFLLEMKEMEADEYAVETVADTNELAELVEYDLQGYDYKKTRLENEQKRVCGELEEILEVCLKVFGEWDVSWLCGE